MNYIDKGLKKYGASDVRTITIYGECYQDLEMKIRRFMLHKITYDIQFKLEDTPKAIIKYSDIKKI